MNRLEIVRQVVDEILRQQPDVKERRCGFVHLYGVAVTSSLLALKRGLDPEICAVTGMLHDIATYRSGDPTNHAQRGAVEAEEILKETGEFRPDEINEICDAIARHSAKDQKDGALAELIKDADVLQHYLYNPGIIQKTDVHWKQRENAVLGELTLPSP
jgi:uncharacterized protein